MCPSSMMYDLIIIGGGPAGLTAAVYAIRKRLNCLLVSPDLGGKANRHMQIKGLDSYQVIDGADQVRRFCNEVEYLDFARILEKAAKLERIGRGFAVTTATGRRLEAKSVILATGADAVRLNVPGADRFFLRGVGYSTISYAPLFLEKVVAIVGADDMGLRGAAELGQIADRVYLVVPPGGAVASVAGGDGPNAALWRRLRNAVHVEVLDDWQPFAVEGENYGERLMVRAPDGTERALEVDGIFVELGLKSHSELVAGLADLDAEGRVIVDGSTQTSIPGLFAAGDVTQLPAEQVLIAIGEGAKAALAAYEYLLKLEEGVCDDR